MEVMALYHLQKMFSFRYFFFFFFFKKRLIFVLDSYLIHRYIIIKYGQVGFRTEICQLLWELWPFFQHVFAKRLRLSEDGPGRWHLCHTDRFLVPSVSSLSFLFLFLPCPSLWSLLLSLLSLFLPFSERWHKMTHKCWCVVKPQHNQNEGRKMSASRQRVRNWNYLGHSKEPSLGSPWFIFVSFSKLISPAGFAGSAPRDKGSGHSRGLLWAWLIFRYFFKHCWFSIQLLCAKQLESISRLQLIHTHWK